MDFTSLNDRRPISADSGRHRAANWTVESIEALYASPFNDLIYRAQAAHRAHFDANAVQLSTFLSIKTGGCPEDCGYCPQAARYHTGIDNEALMSVDEVLSAARCARDKGATRFCMGAAWRGPKQRDRRPQPSLGRNVPDPGQNHARIAQLETDQEHRCRELPRFA